MEDIHNQENKTEQIQNTNILGDVSKTVQKHIHNGVDAPRLNPKYFLGFPCTQVVDATVAPTFTTQDGTILFYYDATHWRVWVRINNLWKSTVLS